MKPIGVAFSQYADTIAGLYRAFANRRHVAALTADAVYRFCESLDAETRALGMRLIGLNPRLAIPEELFRLTESPDRQVRVDATLQGISGVTTKTVTIRQGKKDQRPVIVPTKWMYWNVHIDGLEYTHDLIVEREGVFKECVDAIKMAKILGYQVATNTTVYKETDVKEIEEMFEYFSAMEVDGHTISPGYEYDAAKKDMVSRLGKQPEDFFLTRKMTRQKFAKIQDWGRRFTIFGTVAYQEFLAGKRELTCTAWAIPTRNVKGWKAPCYLMTDGHYPRYDEMLEKVDWNKYGVVDGVARDPRCENCMVHCGYDPSGALSPKLSDSWKNMKYNFGAKPKPYYKGREVFAFNGTSIGKGHLAEAKAAINSPRAAMNGAQSVFSRKEESHAHEASGSCGTGDKSQRDELMAKIAEKNK